MSRGLSATAELLVIVYIISDGGVARRCNCPPPPPRLADMHLGNALVFLAFHYPADGTPVCVLLYIKCCSSLHLSFYMLGT